MKGKLLSVAWFLRRPNLWPQLMHLVLMKMLGDERDTGEQAVEWCRQLAIDLPSAAAKITGRLPPPSLEEAFPEVLSAARVRAALCPIPMGGPGAIDLLYAVAEFLSASRILETGVAYGWSSLSLLLAIRKNPNARLVSTDMPYVRLENDKWVGCIVPDDLRPQWTIIRKADRQALPEALEILGQLDLCHYDSDKTYRGRMWAYPILWRALRPGGVLISDDVGDNLAFRDFCESRGLDAIVVKVPKAVGFQYAGVITKPAE